MSLTFCVGVFASLPRSEASSYVDAVNASLRREGASGHVEPEHIAAHMGSIPYDYLHRLRRAVAYSRNAVGEFPFIDLDADPSLDPILDEEMYGSMESHVICHSDCEGCYVPAIFEMPLFDEAAPGQIIGSTPVALEELAEVASLLEVKLKGRHPSKWERESLLDRTHRLVAERTAWLNFYEAAMRSVDANAMLVFL